MSSSKAKNLRLGILALLATAGWFVVVHTPDSGHSTQTEPTYLRLLPQPRLLPQSLQDLKAAEVPSMLTSELSFGDTDNGNMSPVHTAQTPQPENVAQWNLADQKVADGRRTKQTSRTDAATPQPANLLKVLAAYYMLNR